MPDPVPIEEIVAMFRPVSLLGKSWRQNYVLPSMEGCNFGATQCLQGALRHHRLLYSLMTSMSLLCLGLSIKQQAADITVVFLQNFCELEGFLSWKLADQFIGTTVVYLDYCFTTALIDAK